MSSSSHDLANYLAANVLLFGDVEVGEHTAGMLEPILDPVKLAEVIQRYIDGSYANEFFR